MFKGPDDLNGNGYFYVRLYWTALGFQANIVVEDVLLRALCWFKAKVGPEAVYGIDGRSTEFGCH